MLLLKKTQIEFALDLTEVLNNSDANIQGMLRNPRQYINTNIIKITVGIHPGKFFSNICIMYC